MLEAAIKRIELLPHAKQLQALFHRCLLAAQTRGLSLKRLADDAAAAHFIGRGYPDPSSGAGPALDQFVALELLEGFRYREETHPEFLGELPAGQRLAWTQLAAQDSLANKKIGSNR
jgi:hypothetical protein